MAQKKPKTFESSLKALEDVVEKLEKGELALEAQLKAFEQGVGFSRDCMERLNEMEQKVEKLVQGPEGLEKRPLEDSPR